MQYEERRMKPESNRKYLVQQVEEQSNLCDVVVKKGLWEKKFHRCVLVVSPFFERVLKNNFVEKQTGKIEIVPGTPLTLEMAIMFLYGKKPKLTEDNIEHMLDLAEFLLIPNLKSACINWLKTNPVTEENCMKHLQLSSLYDFEIPKCIDFLMGHMLVMLPNEQMITLTKDSVQELLSNRKLSYVPTDEKVRFLIRWASHQPTRRKVYFRELFEMIDLKEVSKTVIDDLRANESICQVIDAEHIFTTVGEETSRPQNVLVMLGETAMGTFWCLDLDREKWFRLDSSEFDRDIKNYHSSFGTGNTRSEIYFTTRKNRMSTIYNIDLETTRKNRRSTIYYIDLETNACSTYTLEKADADSGSTEFTNVCMMGDLCVANINERVNTNKQINNTDSQSFDVQQRLRVMALLGRSLSEQMVAMEMMQNERSTRHKFIDASTLYTGLRNNDVFEMLPLISFKDDGISTICINKSLSVAMISKSKTVNVYDLTDHKLETIQVKTEHNEKMCQNNDGFVIYNAERCICLTRVTGPSLSTKFKTKEIEFEKKEMQQVKYVFCENTWYRYFHKNYKEPFVFESIAHSEVMSRGSFKGVTWKQLPLPREESKCYGNTIKDQVFKICLPKGRLRCDIECPHCEINSAGTYGRQYVTSIDYDDEYYYEDSSDDEYW